MKYTTRVVTFMLLLFSLFFVFVISQVGRQSDTNGEAIENWRVLPVTGEEAIARQVVSGDEGGWIEADARHPLGATDSLSGVAVWTELKLPELSMHQPALFIPNLFARNIQIYLDHKLIYIHSRNFNIDTNKVLIPLQASDSGKSLFIYSYSPNKRIGFQAEAFIGDYANLLHKYTTTDILDFLIGTALVLVAIIMLVCTFFTSGPHLSSWLALCVIILTLGLLIITYSSAVYTLFEGIGSIIYRLFDLSLFVFLPTMAFFFLKVIGPGKFSVIKKWFYIQSVYSAFCVLLFIINLLTAERYNNIYYLFSVIIMGLFILVEFILLIATAAAYTFKGNRDALLLFTGFGLFVIAITADMVMFYASHFLHHFDFWKWGIVAFSVSMVAILGRQMAHRHDQIVTYSKELEKFNHEMQRSDKMEIVSGLAASVAHEIRNPLQVTRGFLQLISQKAIDKDASYMLLAIEELDRASDIITDFLTFAKPQLDDVNRLHLPEELRRIREILVPLANLHGGKIEIDVSDHLYIRGDSSKLRQALINIIKNSIESFKEQGTVNLSASQEGDQILIRIKDNGEGMSAETLRKLGEPYYSNKKKGTGLGLMVTFRIIEAMSGKLYYTSKLGRGTEAVISFPTETVVKE